MREEVREHLQRATELSEMLGEVLLAAGFSELNPRFSRCLLTMGSHAERVSECLERIAQGHPARQVRVVRLETPQPGAPPNKDAPSTLERARAILSATDTGEWSLDSLARTEEPEEMVQS